MARPKSAPPATPDPVRRPQHKLIGFIGRRLISDYEAASLTYIGRCIAALGHTLVIVPAPGAAAALREGVEAQGGEVRTLEAGVLEVADRTLLYPDPKLTERLRAAYPDIDERENVVFIEERQLDEWVDAMKSILSDYGIARP
jgi:hypothetical protein